MIIKKDKVKGQFKPVTISITIEDQDELFTLQDIAGANIRVPFGEGRGDYNVLRDFQDKLSTVLDEI